MSLEHLDTVIAFAVVMLGVSLLITILTQTACALTNHRGRCLRRALVDLFVTVHPDARANAGEVARWVLQHALISDSAFWRLGVVEDLLMRRWKASWSTERRRTIIGLLLAILAGLAAGTAALLLVRQAGWSAVDVVRSLAPWAEAGSFLRTHPARALFLACGIAAAALVFFGRSWRLATAIDVDELTSMLGKVEDAAGRDLRETAAAIAGRLGAGGPDLAVLAEKVDALSAELPREAAEAHKKAEELAESAKALLPEVESLRAAAAAKGGEGEAATLFNAAMSRAAQRFALRARVWTVVFSVAFVFAAHLDALRLLRQLSQDAELRAGLVQSAGAVMTRAEEVLAATEAPDGSGARSKAAGTAPVEEMAGSDAGRAGAGDGGAGAAAAGGGGEDDAKACRAGFRKRLEEGETFVPVVYAAAVRELQEVRRCSHKKAAARLEKEEAKTPQPPAEVLDPLREAEQETAKNLEPFDELKVPQLFPSREDAVIWLRKRLAGREDLDDLIAEYELGLEGLLGTSRANRMLDQTASIKGHLSRSGLQLFPAPWPGLRPEKGELPGLLVAAGLLSLGAPFWFNVLKNLSNLRPLVAARQEAAEQRREQKRKKD